VTAPAPPLVAERVDTTPVYAGVTLVESIVDVKNSIRSGSWSSAAIGSVYVSADLTLSYLDPLGTVASWIVAMCLEHIEPLTEVLDLLGGDPDAVTAQAQTWYNVATNTRQAADELREAVWREIPQWTGASADEYRAAAATRLIVLQGCAEAAEAKAAATQLAGAVVLVSRKMVRDLIADCVATLAVRSVEWQTEVAVTLGGATPWVGAQIATLCAKWVARVAKVVDELVVSLRRLSALVDRVDELTVELSAQSRTGSAVPPPSDTDHDGRPDVLDPDADGDAVLDDRDGDLLPDIAPPRSGFPYLPTKALEPRYVGETDPAIATEIFGVPSDGVRYLTPDEAEGYRVFVRDGLLYQTNGELLDTTDASSLHSGDGVAIFVMDPQGNLYVSTEHEVGAFHHSSFLAGQPVAGAGEIVVEDGRIVGMSDASGHYRPPPQFLQQVLDQLQIQGLDISGLEEEPYW
jgi:hypothetical protein